MELLLSIPPWLVLGLANDAYDFGLFNPWTLPFAVMAAPVYLGASYVIHKVLTDWVLTLAPGYTEIPYLFGMLIGLRGSVYLYSAYAKSPSRLGLGVKEKL